MSIRYSPYDESLWSHPWDTYKRMQDEAPAYYIEDLDCWALTRFEDIWKASMDRKAYTATHGTCMRGSHFGASKAHWMAAFGPPKEGQDEAKIGPRRDQNR